WVKESDLTQSSPLDHVTVDKNDKTLYLTGKGKAYAKAWGGPKDLVYEDMSDFAGEAFHVNLTEKVGNNTWYRGTFNGNTICIHKNHVYEHKEKPINLTIQQAIKIQKKNTSKTNKEQYWVSKKYIKNAKVTSSALNVRTGPGTKHEAIVYLYEGDIVDVLDEY